MITQFAGVELPPNRGLRRAGVGSKNGSAMKTKLTLMLLISAAAWAQSATGIEKAQLVKPAALLQMLSGERLLVLQVGPRVLYAQAHVPGAEYVGAASQPEGIQALRERVQKLPKMRLIVIYCGCCPWDRCPNVAPAYNELKSLGFTNVKVMFVAHNIGADWVDKGYPTEKGK